MNAAAPDGASPRRSITGSILEYTELPRRDSKNLLVLLAFHPLGIQRPEGAMRRGALISVIFMVRV